MIKGPNFVIKERLMTTVLKTVLLMLFELTAVIYLLETEFIDQGMMVKLYEKQARFMSRNCFIQRFF